MDITIITKQQIEKRKYWIEKIHSLSSHFDIESNKIEEAMDLEIKNKGIDVLLGHLRFCGTIPEYCGYNTTEEKLHSKYTDVIIHQAYLSMGFIWD